MSEPKSALVLPALNSNNLAFNIFSYFHVIEAVTKIRALCKKGKEKSLEMPNHCAPITFDRQNSDYVQPLTYVDILLNQLYRNLGAKIPI